MGNSVFIVWRESIEAMLVIGILHAWIQRSSHLKTGLRALWLGVLVGLVLASALGWLMLTVQSELGGAALEWFQTLVLFTAAGLIAQMVLWMQRHGRGMRQSLENSLSRAAGSSGALGIAAVAALGIAREGAETVIFLYGMGLESGHPAELTVGATCGFLLALVTAWTMSRGLRFLSYPRFFQISGFLLLLLAAALVVAGSERLIDMGWLPVLVDPVWDTSSWLDDTTRLGNMISSLTGYRARPALTLVLIYMAYWSTMLDMRRRMMRHA